MMISAVHGGPETKSGTMTAVGIEWIEWNGPSVAIGANLRNRSDLVVVVMRIHHPGIGGAATVIDIGREIVAHAASDPAVESVRSAVVVPRAVSQSVTKTARAETKRNRTKKTRTIVNSGQRNFKMEFPARNRCVFACANDETNY